MLAPWRAHRRLRSRAGYKPPVAAVLGYDPTERFAYIGRVLIEDASDETFIETTVASRKSNRLLAATEARFDQITVSGELAGDNPK